MSGNGLSLCNQRSLLKQCRVHQSESAKCAPSTGVMVERLNIVSYDSYCGINHVVDRDMRVSVNLNVFKTESAFCADVYNYSYKHSQIQSL